MYKTLYSLRFVYTTKTISTIVDYLQQVANLIHVYTTKTISTIVDSEYADAATISLYDQNNFYYCRLLSILP